MEYFIPMAMLISSKDHSHDFTGYAFSVLVLLFAYVHQARSQGPFVRDVARSKPITANLTCGFMGPEQYYEHNQVYTSGRERLENEKTCANISQFPASSMTDGNPATIWQSTARTNFVTEGWGTSDSQPDAIITLDLEQVNRVNRITLRMGDAKRPGRIAIRKATSGLLFRPWVYLVTDEAACTALFQTRVLNSPSRLDSVVCRAYGRARAQAFEEVAYDFTQITEGLESWRDVRYIRIEFFDLELTLGPSGGKFQHYSVASLEVLASCECNGQELSCDQSVETGKFECTCGGFTQGRYCEECQPLYNQIVFTQSQPCEECNCFSHADACYYDPVTANASLSINIQGEKRGGGVCIGCRDNTTGVNCERCIDYYFRPEDRLPEADSPCIPCQCNRPGVRVNEETQLVGDCVRNDAGALLPAGMLPGDCFCKDNVRGFSCDRCESGFFNLTQINPAGCQECLCSALGSTNETSVCEPDATGQCPCKENVHSRQCDMCKDEFYGLSAQNEFGCTSCECDPGAAYNNVCDLVNGDCPCRSNIRDRKCLRPMSGYYYPGPHFIHGEFEDLNGPWGRDLRGFSYFGYAVTQPGTAISAYMTIPVDTQFGSTYMILLRYSGNTLAAAPATLQIVESGNPVPVLASDILITVCPSGWCYYTTTQVELSRGQTYQVVLSSDTSINMDQVVAFPFDYINAEGVLGPTLQADFSGRCAPLVNDLGAGGADQTFCEETMFSLSMFYLDGALSCECHPLGSYDNDTCELFDGQCPCKPGVFTRQCSECQLEFYQLSFDGCQPCDCATDDKICDRVSGQCNCPPHTDGRQCDSCQLNFFNWTSDAGCQDCECSTVGSSNLQCNLVTGVCECKQGVVGDKCDTCMEGFKGFGPTGCSSCQCNVDGSAGTMCEASSGQCPCKNNTEGLLCELCKGGTFYNAQAHDDGCLNCVCMGITTECQSSLWHKKTFPLDIANRTDPSTSILLLAPDGEVLPFTVPIVTVQGRRMAQVQVGQDAQVYWQHPGFSGDLVALYESTVSFTVYYTSTEPIVTMVESALLIYGHNNAVFSFGYESVPIGEVTERSVVISLENVVGADGVNATREQLLLTLTDVKKVLIPANYMTRQHQTHISSINYKMADKLGIGDRALGVEDCSCPEGYTGLSCQDCAAGYRREGAASHAFLGVCVPCQCYGHSSKCDPDSGECIACQHNTHGFNCEFCRDGFHGDATSGTAQDCSECPCYSPRVVNSTCQILASQPQCLHCAVGYTGSLCDRCELDYFGDPSVVGTGTCEACTCSGNSDICDPLTGLCVDCGFNTTGPHCEVCADGYYGNATAQDCRDCGCDLTGAADPICDAESGNCTCWPGVGSRTCDSCLPQYFGFLNGSFPGCQDCVCNERGSLDLQCDESGVCTCGANVEANNIKCDRCVETFWGLPVATCTECGCDQFGSVDAAAPCSRIAGECVCQPGVAGRQCNQCDHLYTGTPQIGCTKCGRCEDSLGNDTLALEAIAEQYINQSLVVLQVHALDPILQNLTSDIAEVQSSLEMSEGRLDTLTGSVANLTQSEPQYRQIVQDLEARVSDLVSTTSVLLSSSLAELERLESLEGKSGEALSLARTLQAMAPEIINRMSFYNTSAYQLLQLGNSIYINMNETFDEELRSVQAESSAASTALTEAQDMEAMITQQSSLAASLETLTESAQAQLKALSDDVTFVTTRLRTIAYDIGTLYIDLNVTQYNRQRTEGLLTEIQSLLDFSDMTLVQSAETFAQSTTWLQDALVIHNGGVPGALPIDTAVDLTGITGWLSASDSLQSQLVATSAALTTYQQAVTETEQTAAQLTLMARAIQEAFLLVQPRGQDAVSAINNYEQVVQSLEESLQMALQANDTMQQTLRLLQAVSVTDLSRRATDSLAASEATLLTATTWNDTATALEPLVEAANASLQDAIIQWSDVNVTLADLQRESTAFSETVQENTLMARIVEGNSLADRTLDTAQNVHSLNEALRGTVDQQGSQMAVIQAIIQNTSRLEIQIQDDLTSFQDTLTNTVERTISETQADFTGTSATLLTLEAKLATIEAKLERAREALTKLEQPVHFPFNTYETMSNPDSDRELMYTEISFEFKYTYVAKGILFFTESQTSDEKLLVQLVDGSVLFEIHNVDAVMRTSSPAVLCGDCWFRVVATRYGIDAHLTVTRMSTGGVAVTSMREESSQHELLQTDATIYVGGLPEDFPLTNVYPEPQFEGCIYNLRYNGQPLPIWQRALRAQSEAECCAQPPELPGPATQDAVTFKGYGYIKLNYGQFSVQEEGQASLKFRTFDPNAVLLLLDDEGTQSYYGIFLRNGNVVFAIESDTGVQTVVDSSKTYNDGQWYKVSAVHDTTLARLSVQKVVFVAGDTVDTKSQSTAIDLRSLASASMTMGGHNPNTTLSRGPVTSSYAGAMVDLQLSRGASKIPTPQTLAAFAGAHVNVDLYVAFEEVVSGIGVDDPSGYVTLRGMPDVVSSIEFQLLTYEHTGIIAFAQLQYNPPLTYFYIGLFNGDVLVLFDQGLGTRIPVRTRGLYLATGQPHTIKMDFSSQNSPRLTVDREVHFGSVTMSPGMYVEGNSIYMFGVPPTVSLPTTQIPTSSVLIGGVRNLRVNDREVNLFNEVTVSRLYQKRMYLSGLPAPPAELPPPPYVTTPPPPTTPAPTCAAPLDFTLSREGVRFGDFSTSFQGFDVTASKGILRSAFSLRMQFRAVQDDGILAYFASSDQLNPANYFAVYMQDGYLGVSMRSTTTRPQGSPPDTLNILSNFQYNDGVWWEMEVLRMNDFVALIVFEKKDYKNNEVASPIGSTIEVESLFYLGGVPPTLKLGFPFTSAIDIPVGGVSFRGCIRKAEAVTHDFNTLSLDVSNPTLSEGVTQCYEDVAPGFFINGTNSYVKVMSPSLSSFNFGQTFNVRVAFAGTERSGVLVSMWQSASQFFYLQLYDGQVRAVIGNRVDTDAPFVAVSSSIGAFHICDNEAHSIQLQVTSRVTLTVDGSEPEAFDFPAATDFQYEYMSQQPLYIGLPDSAWTVPTLLGAESYRGCVLSVAVDDVTYDLTQSTDSRAVVIGCPAVPGVESNQLPGP